MKSRFGIRALAACLLAGVLVFCSGATIYTAVLSRVAPPASYAASAEHKPNPYLTGVKQLVNILATVAENVKSDVDSVCIRNNVITPALYSVFGTQMRLIGRNMVPDQESDVYRLKNGYLAYFKQYDESEIRAAAERVARFSDSLRQQGVAFDFVFTASKEDDTFAQYPKGLESNYSAAEQLMADVFDENDVSYFLSKPALLARNSDFYSWFFRTDHHWNPQAGFAVAQDLARDLRDSFGLAVDADLLENSGFTTETHKGIFLGSQGKKVTTAYAKEEDLTFAVPTFETDFRLELPDPLTLDGSFSDTLIAEKYLQPDLYRTYTYNTFLYGDVSLTRVENKLAQNDTRVLVVKHSKANVVDPYLALTVKYLDIIDPRHYELSIPDYIQQTQPDIVITFTGLGDDFIWTGE